MSILQSFIDLANSVEKTGKLIQVDPLHSYTKEEVKRLKEIGLNIVQGKISCGMPEREPLTGKTVKCEVCGEGFPESAVIGLSNRFCSGTCAQSTVSSVTHRNCDNFAKSN